MPYKDILVHIDASRNCSVRLAAAVKLAQRHQAHLTGLFVGTLPHVPEYVAAQLGPQIQEIQTRYLEDEAAKAKKAFESATNLPGLSSEWRAVTGDVVSQLALHGRYVDLVVLGQRDPDAEDASSQEDVVDDLVFELGRPILVVPYVGKYPHLGERVMVAWNASRESTRAVSDALPLLAEAKKVLVLAINPQGGNNGHGAIPGADIAQHMARHGVTAEAQHVVSEDINVGDMLLSRAADEEVDLIVMGCYGRSRLSEMILGGASRHILRHMTVPVLLSH
jgi:nucleotide-binding universal stress UspA family protein